MKIETFGLVRADEDLKLVSLTFLSSVETTDSDLDLDVAIVTIFRATRNLGDSKWQ